MAITLTLELPAEFEAQLRASHPDLSAFAREALALELFREGKITHFELGQALGLSCQETDDLLNLHGVHESILDQAILDEELKCIRLMRAELR
jgi:Uncharacterised protein family (UPF0175)